MSAYDISQGVGAIFVVYDARLTSDAASFDVQNIPQVYAHLECILVARGTVASTATQIEVRFNNDSGSNYDRVVSRGRQTTMAVGEEIGSTSLELGQVAAASASAGMAGQARFCIGDYAGTTLRKQVTAENGAGWGDATDGQEVRNSSGEWRSTNAITRITVFPASGNWLAGSRFTIYGLGAA